MRKVSFDDFLNNKNTYIGKTVIHEDYTEDILTDIYDDNGMLWFIMSNKNNSMSGIREIVSGYDYGSNVSVSIRYCGSFTILTGE